MAENPSGSTVNVNGAGVMVIGRPGGPDPGGGLSQFIRWTDIRNYNYGTINIQENNGDDGYLTIDQYYYLFNYGTFNNDAVQRMARGMPGVNINGAIDNYNVTNNKGHIWVVGDGRFTNGGNDASGKYYNATLNINSNEFKNNSKFMNHAGSTVSISGKFYSDNGAKSTLTNNGTIIVNKGGKLSLANGGDGNSATLNNGSGGDGGDITIKDGGVLIFPAHSTINNYSAIRIEDGVSTKIQPGMTLNLFSGQLYHEGTMVNNNGIINIKQQTSQKEVDQGWGLGDYEQSYSDVKPQQIGFTNTNKGIINIDGVFSNSTTMLNQTDSQINISEQGCLQISSPLSSTLNNQAVITNDGQIINYRNDPNAAAGFINNGTYQGTGQIKGSWTDHGTVKPGNSSGGMLVDGNYYKEDGIKEIELGGTYHGDGDRTATEHDWIEITGDMELSGNLDVSLIDGFKLSVGDSFVITKVDGDLSGEYDGLNEGDSLGRFKSENGGKLDLFVTYEGGDGNDIELYTKSFFGVLPNSLSDTRIIGSDDEDSLTGTTADEVMHGGNGDDVLLGAQGDDQVTGGNGDDWLDGGLGDDTLKGDRGADTYKLSSGDDSIDSFSVDENDGISVKDGVDLSFKQVGDDLLIKADGIHTTLLDVDKDEFLAADCIDYI